MNMGVLCRGLLYNFILQMFTQIMWHHIKEDSLSPTNSGTETCKKQYTFPSMCNEFQQQQQQQQQDELHVWCQAFQYLTILLMHCFLHTVLIALPTSPHPLSQLPST